jgi:predicted GNAT family N-acyltransferase
VKTAIRVTRVSSKEELKHAFGIRMRIFVKEQGVPQQIELDRDDERAFHFLAVAEGKPIGTARVVIRRGSARIGRMAVLKIYRRRGVGATLLKRAVRFAKARGARNIFLHAQVHVVGFYDKAGFRCVGPVFDEAGIPHRKMVLRTSR